MVFHLPVDRQKGRRPVVLRQASDQRKPAAELGLTTALVADLLSRGYRPWQIARRLDLAKSTASHHLSRLNANAGRGYVGRRATVEILARSGVRVSELCDMRIGHVRVHDVDGARFRIPDAKTETGIREVQMSPDLVETVVEHIDRLRRMGAPTGWTLHITDISLSAGAGFLVVISGAMMLMPGLPKTSRALDIDVDARGQIIGMS